MGTPLPFVVGCLIAINSLVSFIGFNNEQFFDQFKFDIRLKGPQNRYRLLTAAFLHVSWAHLFFNMFTLYLFGYAVVDSLGTSAFVMLYFGSLLLGNLFAAYFHRNDSYYAAVGASGGVAGVVFSTILLYPALELYLFFIPIPIPGYLFAAAYVAYSLYGMKKQQDNIGHTAHLGGAIWGIILPLIYAPELLMEAKQTLLYIVFTAAGVGFWLFRQR